MAAEKQRLTFISYSRADKDFALELAQELRSSGFLIWLDQLDIPTGTRWDDEVEKALLECEIFMVILTPDSIASNNVKDEIGYAIDSNKRILPVLLENAILPFRLRRFQYVDFTSKSHEEGIEAAKQLLRRLLSVPASPVSSTPSGARKQEATPLAGVSSIKPPAAESIDDQRAKAIQHARERERLERQVQAAHPVPTTNRKDQAQGRPFTKVSPVTVGAGIFSIVCLVAGWIILRPLILPPDTDGTPITEAPISPNPIISTTLPPPTSTFTSTPTLEATYTPTHTEAPTVTSFAPQEPDQFIYFYFLYRTNESKNQS